MAKGLGVADEGLSARGQEHQLFLRELCPVHLAGNLTAAHDDDAVAHADQFEYVAKVRKVFDDSNVAFQTAELGKVDVGGGGTIAYIAALYGMNVIDSGVAVLSMHAPWEVTSKADIYEVEKAYKAFLENA